MNQKSKKFISIVLSAVMLLSLFTAVPFTAAAQDNAGLTVKVVSNFFPDKEATYTNYETDADGNSFVTIKFLINYPGMYVINCDIDEVVIDPTVLEMKAEYMTTVVGRQEVVNVFPGILEQQIGAGVVNFTSDSRMVGNFTSVMPAAYAYGENGAPLTLIQLRFKVLDKNAGETTVRCDIDSMSFCEDTLEEPDCKYCPADSGVINTALLEKFDRDVVFDNQSNVLYGDVNGDGEVNAKDRITLTRNLAKWAAYPEIVKANSDLNCDGTVNAKDRIILIRHLAKWEKYMTLPVLD